MGIDLPGGRWPTMGPPGIGPAGIDPLDKEVACVGISEEPLRQAVDEILETAWPDERRRARQRLVRSSAFRWAGGMLGVLGLCVALYCCTGMAVSWVALAFIGVLAAVAAVPDPSDRAHLRRQAPAPVPRLVERPRRPGGARVPSAGNRTYRWRGDPDL